jgi:hypothetical protein
VSDVVPGPAADLALTVALTDEERIEYSKYWPSRRPRLFEEERFLFPESYGVNRVRLLVKDPEWIFAYWDVDPASRRQLRDELGDRSAALAQLTLRVCDVDGGGMSVIVLPEGSRSWYVRADRRRRAYRAELGLTLPSGEFRRLAESNLVVTPRVGPSPEPVRRVLTYSQASEIPVEEARQAAVLDRTGVDASAGPWRPPASVAPGGEPDAPRGGASDAFRR